MSKRFLLTLLTLMVIGVAAAIAIFLAKGYRLSPKEGRILGTGILSITSIPDQASVYLDGHLTTATDANVNSLKPKSYRVRVIKEGFIPWEKDVEIKEGLVTEVKATLFRAIPSIYPLTYSGAIKPLLSPDGQKLVYIVPPPQDGTSLNLRKSGIWTWELSERPIAFARGGEPHQVALWDPRFTQAKLRFSPDSSQILVNLPNEYLLLDTSKLNDPPRNISATIDATLESWSDDQKDRDNTRLGLIKDLNLRKIASSSASLKWAPDETKFLYCQKDCGDKNKAEFKVVDLESRQSHVMPKTSLINWLPDSEHLVVVEAAKDQTQEGEIISAKISIVEYDGANKSEIYAGNFDPLSVFSWFDSSKLVIISSLPTITASQPNLYGINLK